MAKVKLNPLLVQVRGAVGGLVFKRYGDEVVLSRKADLEGREATAAQQAARERFRQARAKGQPVFSLTVADFFNAPSVDEVDVSGYAGQVGDACAPES